MSEKRVYMVVFAHPDDAEFGCAGTVKKLTEAGHAVYYACLTNGNVGSNDRSMTPERLAEIRHGEMEAAAQRLGVKQVFFLDYGDTTLYPSLEMRGKVVRLLRQVKADIVFGMDPWLKDLTHIDHRTAAWVAIEAASNAGWHLAHYEQVRDEGLEPHPVQEIHLFYTDDPTHHVDITDVIEDRVESFLCHRSQIGFGAPQGEAFEKARQETAEWVRGAARDMGKQAGCAYAESFKVLEISGGHSQRAEAEG